MNCAYEPPKGQKQMSKIMTFPLASPQPWCANLAGWLKQADPELFIKSSPYGFSGLALSAIGHYTVKDSLMDNDETSETFACPEIKPMLLPQTSSVALSDRLLDHVSASPWLTASMDAAKTIPSAPTPFQCESGKSVDIHLSNYQEALEVLDKHKPASATLLSVEFTKPPFLNRVRIVSSSGEPSLDQMAKRWLLVAKEIDGLPERGNSNDPVVIEVDWKGISEMTTKGNL